MQKIERKLKPHKRNVASDLEDNESCYSPYRGSRRRKKKKKAVIKD